MEYKCRRNEIHFLIPGGAGGGWDMIQGGQDALLKSDLVDNVSFQNLSGGGGVSHLIETAQRQPNTLRSIRLR